jgi:hypothetical protein
MVPILIHVLLLLLHSDAVASTFEGCEVQRFGSEDVVKCEGAVASLREFPGPTLDDRFFTSFVNRADRSEMGGSPSTSIAAVKGDGGTHYAASCHAFKQVDGAADRCKALVTALLTRGIPADLPRTTPELPGIGLEAALGRQGIGAAKGACATLLTAFPKE